MFYDRFHSHIRFQITMVRADYTFIVSRTIGFVGTVEISIFHENPSIFRGQSAPLSLTRIQYRWWWRRRRGVIIKRDTWRNPWSNYKNARFVELNREILRKRRVGTYSQRNPFYGNHLLRVLKRDPYLARFKRSAFLPRRRHFPRKRIPFSFALSARGNFLH